MHHLIFNDISFPCWFSINLCFDLIFFPFHFWWLEVIVSFCSVFRFQGLSVATSCACCAKSEILSSCLEGKAAISESSQAVSKGHLFCYTANVCSKFFMGRCGLSSHAGAESSESEDNLEDGFSELETRASADANEDELISEPEFDDDNAVGEPSQSALELLDTETDFGDKRSLRKGGHSELFIAIATPGVSVHSVLDKWVAEGKDLEREEFLLAMFNLRKRRMYAVALQVI